MAAILGPGPDSTGETVSPARGFRSSTSTWATGAWTGPRPRASSRPAAHARGIPFGIIYVGEGTQGDGGGGSDADWAASAERRFATFEAQYGGRPDHAVLQSWVDHPDYALPETAPFTFTWLLARYARPRPALQLSLRRGRIEGRLVGASGTAVAGARVELAAVPLDGPGSAGVYTVTGIVATTVGQVATLDSAEFAATPGARFTAVSVGRLPAGKVLVQAWYRGDARRFPAYAERRP